MRTQWALEPFGGVMASDSVPPMNLGAYGGLWSSYVVVHLVLKIKSILQCGATDSSLKKTLLHGCRSLHPFPHRSTQNWERKWSARCRKGVAHSCCSLIITTWKIQCLCRTSSVHRQGHWHFHFDLYTLLLYITVMGVIAFSSMQVPVKVISRIVIRIFASCKNRTTTNNINFDHSLASV